MAGLAELLAQAETAEQAGEIGQARDLFQQAVELRPDIVRGQAGLLRLAMLTADHDGARSHIEALRSGAGRIFQAAHSGLIKSDARDQAAQLTALARPMLEDCAVVRFFHGQQLLDQKDHAGALAEFRAAITLPDPPVNAFVRLAGLLRVADDIAEAVAVCEQGLALFPDHAGLEKIWARVLRSAGRPEEALGVNERLLAQSPGNATLLLGIGECLRDLNRTEEAVTRIEQAGIDDESGRLDELLSQLYSNRGEAKKARDQIKRLLERDGIDAGLRRRLGQTLLREGDSRTALDVLKAVLPDRPNDAQAHYHLSVAHERTGDFDAASDSAEKAVELDPENHNMYAHLASISVRAGFLNRANDAMQTNLSLRDRKLPDRLADGLDAIWDEIDDIKIPQRRIEWAWQIAKENNPDRAQWERLARWGHRADRIILDWFECRYDQRDEIAALSVETDWSDVQAAYGEGKGVLVTGGHTGPLFSSIPKQQDSGCPSMWMAARPPLGAIPFNQHLISTTVGSRHALSQLVEALKQGKVIYIMIDGSERHQSRPVPFEGATVYLPDTVPKLIMRTGCVPFWMSVEWIEDKIHIILKRAIRPEPDEPVADFIQRWNAFYLSRIRDVMSRDPRNLKLAGGFWDDIR